MSAKTGKKAATKATTKVAPAKELAEPEAAAPAPAEPSVTAPANLDKESTNAAASTESVPAAAPSVPAAAGAPGNAADSVFAGQVVALTGTLITMQRDEARKLLAAAGAKLADGVSKQTTLLIYGARAGSKLAAAKRLNIALMTEAEMVAQLTKLPANQATLGGAAQQLAEAAAAEQQRTAEVRAVIDAANTSFVSKHGLTLPQLLLKYFQLFAKRPDVFVTTNNQGQAASASVLLRRHGSVPPEWLAVHSEIGALHFGWVFAADKAERSQYSEGYKGGRIVLVDPAEFRWWPRQDWQKDYDFKEDALFDDFVNEGLTKLSYSDKEHPTSASLIFDNTNDCVRHPMGGIFRYLTDGARAGFTWYWQMGPREGTDALFDASLPRDTPAATVEELLQKQGLSAAEAQAMRSWLGADAVILLHQSLTATGVDRQKLAKRFPGANKTSKRSMDIALIEQLTSTGAALSEAEWQQKLAAHAEFLASGGAGGQWQLFEVAKMPMCIYTGATAKTGEQLVLRLKSIKGNSAKGANLTYADLSGACCDGVDFSGADLSHSVMTDSLFSGANFHGAKLQDADLSGARLQNANFQGADLTNADFEATDLTGADFRKAKLTGAKFPGAILKDVKG